MFVYLSSTDSHKKIALYFTTELSSPHLPQVEEPLLPHQLPRRQTDKGPGGRERRRGGGRRGVLPGLLELQRAEDSIYDVEALGAVGGGDGVLVADVDLEKGKIIWEKNRCCWS